MEFRQTLKNKIIQKLKFINDDTQPILRSYIQQNNVNTIINQIENSNIPDIKTSDIQESISQYKNEQSIQIFKQIQMLFHILIDLIKYKILNINEEDYQKIESKKLKFIKDIDNLVLMMGCYYKAFNKDIEEQLYHIVMKPYYKDFITISEINIHMMPFVVDDKLQMNKLHNDFRDFTESIKNLACEILDVDTDFDEHNLMDYNNYDDDECTSPEPNNLD